MLYETAAKGAVNAVSMMDKPEYAAELGVENLRMQMDEAIERHRNRLLSTLGRLGCQHDQSEIVERFEVEKFAQGYGC
ncbi:MAG TPA: hypothetical protein VFL85_05210 [Candidatus Saccharimonadales bacterium]|nr:hypothetical protein [Candidatus Saccharimonadales bacterium]